TPVQVKENTAPAITLSYPRGTQVSPTLTNISKPSIMWNQTDAAQTTFEQYQVQLLDSNGTVVIDSGIVTQPTTDIRGSWLVPDELPVDQLLQVRVKVRDQSTWS